MSEENAPAFRRNDARRSPPVNYDIKVSKVYNNAFGEVKYLLNQVRLYGEIYYAYNPKFKTVFLKLERDEIKELELIRSDCIAELGLKNLSIFKEIGGVNGINIKVR